MTWENRLTFEVSSADPEADPVWVDLTLRVRDVLQRIEVDTGRQNDLEQSEPTVVTLLLDNADDALTYGNTLSPYGAWWGPGRKCRLRETVAGAVMDLTTGYLQTPTERINLVEIDQTVAVSIVDRLGRLASSAPFVSTLDAHIEYAGRNATDLRHYTMCDAGPQFVESAGRSEPATFGFSFKTSPAIIEPRGGTPIPGDDVTPFLVTLNEAPTGLSSRVAASFATPVTLSGTDVLTITVWMRRKTDYQASVLSYYVWLFNPLNLDSAILRNQNGGALFRVTGTFSGGASQVTTTGLSDASTERWAIGGAQVSLSPNSVTSWFDDQQESATLSGAPPASATFDRLWLNVNHDGSVAHVMIHVGPPGSYTHTDFLAQREVGLYGLERQTTGERIRTIATYAGIPTGEYANTIDPGCSIMQTAALAGKTPLDAMREAELTEQGLLYVDGAGRLVFRDRRSLYNI